MTETGRMPFVEYAKCPKCGTTRGRSEKMLERYCPGAPIEGGRSDTACRFGSDEHLHVQCAWCQFDFGMDTAGGVPPLTAEETLDVRELLRQARNLAAG